MPKLILLRHLKSQWNVENRFAGCVDNPISKEGKRSARKVAEIIANEKIDVIFTSPLFRNKDTVSRILELGSRKYPIFVHLDAGKMKDWGNFNDLSGDDIPVFVSEKLNERYYGKLQGLNKADTIKKYGPEKVRLWRRSYNVKPPGGESLAQVVARTTPFYRQYIERRLRKGENVMIVASHNSLRAVIKYIEKIPNEKVINVEVPFGGFIKYRFDKSLKLLDKNGQVSYGDEK